MTIEQMLSVKEVANMLGMSGDTVRRMISENQFPNARKLRPEKLTSRYQIPRSDVTAYQQRVGSFPEIGHSLVFQ